MKNLLFNNVFVNSKFPKSTKVFDAFWNFAAERQEIFYRRLGNELSPWTSDRILLKYKFTNTYRASDKVSQYLIKDVIYRGEQNPKELFFRIILFKLFNKIETWELLLNNFRSINFGDYKFSLYNRILSDAFYRGVKLYSGSYIMASPNKFGYVRKHSNHLKLIEKMMNDLLPEKIVESKNMEELFCLLKSYPSIGDFLAYQLAIDINYSILTDFGESDFVIPGPGASDGISKCFINTSNYSEIDIIKMVHEHQDVEFKKRNINFKNLFGRNLQLIDCQNLFCEISKYSRIAFPEIKGISDRNRIKQIFRPTSFSFDYWYPPKWKINSNVANYLKNGSI